MKTYSRADRRRANDGQPATKRRRVSMDNESISCAASSRSNSDQTLHALDIAMNSSSTVPASSPDRSDESRLSDPIQCPSSPPSSPPPATIQAQKGEGSLRTSTSMTETPRDSVPSIQKRPLAEGSTNPQRRPQSKQQKKPKKYTQLHLDLGQKVRTRCKTCGMEYAPSVAEDSSVHQKFHDMNVGGVELGKTFVESEPCNSRTVWQGQDRCRIVECGWRDARMLKNKVRVVLDLVDTELGALKIEDERLWATKEKDLLTPCFRAYLLLQGSKCIGLCLAEDIDLAYKVLAEDKKTSSPSTNDMHRRTLKTADKPDVVLMGIARIWVSSSHRKGGLATHLLDCAQRNCIYGKELRKKYIAFSQPTDSGTALARKWYGKATGWHVYTG